MCEEKIYGLEIGMYQFYLTRTAGAKQFPNDTNASPLRCIACNIEAGLEQSNRINIQREQVPFGIGSSCLRTEIAGKDIGKPVSCVGTWSDTQVLVR